MHGKHQASYKEKTLKSYEGSVAWMFTFIWRNYKFSWKHCHLRHAEKGAWEMNSRYSDWKQKNINTKSHYGEGYHE